MRNLNWIRSTWLALVAVGCSGSPAGMTSGALSGRVNGDSGGTTVSAYRIESNGSLTAAANTSAATGSDGRYHLDVTIADDGAPILVRAASGTQAIGAVAVAGHFDTDGMIHAAPIDADATTRADVVVAARGAGTWSDAATLSHLRAYVTTQVTTALRGSASYQADVTLAARGSVAAAAAWSAMLRARGAGEAQLDAAAASLSAADAQLDAALDAGGSSGAPAAEQAYLDAHAQAFLDAGMSADMIADAAIAAADASRVYAASLSTQARAATIAQAEQVRAQLATRSTESTLVALGASNDAQQAATAAGVSLHDQLVVAAQTGAGVDASVHQAWATYQSAATAALDAACQLSFEADDALQVAVKAALSSFVAARASLSLSADSSATAQAEVDALAQFESLVMAQSQLLSRAGLSDAHATAALRIIAQLDASLHTDQ